MDVHRSLGTRAFTELLGVPALPPALHAFDPGYDLTTLTGHLDQSGHLMSRLKISMACWMVADEQISRAKTAVARARGVPTVSGGGPFEIATDRGLLDEYLDLCADIGFDRIEAGQGFTDIVLSPRTVVAQAAARDLEVQFELGAKHEGPFTEEVLDRLLRLGWDWLEAGASELVIEARESAQGVGIFGTDGTPRFDFADRIVEAFGIDKVVFEAPDKRSQFALLSHFGPPVNLSNVRLEEVLRIEIYRRGLHSDAYGEPMLRPDRVTVLEHAK